MGPVLLYVSSFCQFVLNRAGHPGAHEVPECCDLESTGRSSWLVTMVLSADHPRPNSIGFHWALADGQLTADGMIFGASVEHFPVGYQIDRNGVGQRPGPLTKFLRLGALAEERESL